MVFVSGTYTRLAEIELALLTAFGRPSPETLTRWLGGYSLTHEKKFADMNSSSSYP